MIKKFIFIIILFLCFLFNIDYIKADSYNCSYKVSFGTKEYTFTATFNPEKKSIEFGNLCWNDEIYCRGGSVSSLDEYLIEHDSTLADVKDELIKQKDENLFSGYCDSTLLVFKYWSNGVNHENLKILFNDTLEANAKEYMNGNFSSGTYKDLTNTWAEIVPDKSTASFKDVAYNCDSYTKLFENIQKSAQTIKDCKENCSILYVDYERTKSKLKDFCLVQYAHLDYGKSCLNACLNAEAQIDELGVEDFDEFSACGFSEKLIIYIANIVKWLKYIIPVIVIVLGILDFIKAIASEKDDDMKKAQGHFIKRLIAAALIFIIPFIIEFVLDKMGFASNGCGIIDL